MNTTILHQRKQRLAALSNETVVEIVRLNNQIDRTIQAKDKSEKVEAEYEELRYLLKKENEKLKHLKTQELNLLKKIRIHIEEEYNSCEPGHMVELYGELSELDSNIARLNNYINNV